jgi:serine phosphatase RsbU (regulator of sigma subunit)
MTDHLISPKTIDKHTWKAELENSSSRFHIVGAWVAIIFDPIFGITDYLNIEEWAHLLAIRFGISAITLSVLLMRKRFQIPSYIIVFVPFLLISLQNAYTFSLIELDDFTGHSLNYIALFIGAGMFILWHWHYSAFMVGLSIIATAVFMSINHRISLSEAMVNGGLLLLVVSLFMILLIQTRYSLTVKTIKAQLALEQSNQALAEQKEVTESKNRNIMDSIRYANRIQTATLPSPESLGELLDDGFVLFKPRDVVSGDFYWLWHQGPQVLIAAMDCTGHGVPGAFMSMKGDALLNQIVNVEGITQPDKILNLMHHYIRQSLRQKERHNNDGMDGTICLIDLEKRTLTFAGAKNPLFFVQNGEGRLIKGDKMPIGGVQRELEALLTTDLTRLFTPHTIDISVPTCFYMFSDGYQDQFGGPKKRKFLGKNLQELLLTLHQQPMAEQKRRLDETIENWRAAGNERQIDDILVIGGRV